MDASRILQSLERREEAEQTSPNDKEEELDIVFDGK